MMKKLFAALILMACSISAHAQYFPYTGQVIINSQGAKIGAFASVRVCTGAASGNPCVPLATIYSNATGAGGARTNPMSADQNGNFTVWAPTGVYLISVTYGTVSYAYYISTGSVAGPGQPVIPTTNCPAHNFFNAFTQPTTLVCAQPAVADILNLVLPQNTPAVPGNFLSAYNSATGAFSTASVPAGTVTESGGTTGYLPKWGVVPNLINSVVDEGITTPNVVTVANTGGVTAPSFQTNGAASGVLTLNGATSGSAAISVADIAGSAATLLLPIATAGGSGYVLTSDGASPQQTSWTAPASVVPARYKTKTCLITIGGVGTNSIALSDDNDAAVQCGNDTGSDETITAVACYADAGSPTVTPILTGGGATSILSGALTCGTASWAAGTLNGTPVVHSFSANGATCSVTPCTLDGNITTAGGTAHMVLIKVTSTL